MMGFSGRIIHSFLHCISQGLSPIANSSIFINAVDPNPIIKTGVRYGIINNDKIIRIQNAKQSGSNSRCI
jgi:hypothetical protein